MEQQSIQREEWNSKLGFILAAVGSAVGLGNLWGFAYRSSQGGGAAFLLLYIFIVLIVCLPVFIAELALGRNSSSSALLAPTKLGGNRWGILGFLFFIAPLGIASYYSVIMGWTADSLFHSLFFGLPQNLQEAESFFGSISSGSSVLLGHTLSLVLTAVIVSSGIKKGIEKVTKFFMPILFFLIIALAIWSTSLSGAWDGYKTFLFKLDISEIRNPATIRNAFTQAFFSLSLGIGVMITYASYLKKRSNLPKLSIGVASLDTLVGLLAGFITFPIIYTFGLSGAVSSDPVGALFISIPTGLGAYGLTGRIIAITFFALAYIAAITSSVSLLEVPVSSLIDKYGFKRERSVWIITFFLFLAGIPSALNLNFLGIVDSIFGGVLLIFGGLLVSFFMGWVVPNKFEEELNSSGIGSKLKIYIKFMLKWVSFPVIGFGLYVSVFDLIKNWIN